MVMCQTGSGLSADAAAAAVVAYDEVQATDDAVWWLQSMPHEGGRVALVRLAGDGREREVTGPGADVGTDLHGYGGAAYAVDGGRIWYVDASDGHLRILDHEGGIRIALERRDDERYGDLAARDGRLWCVRESAVGDELVEIGPGGEVRVLTRTDGFLGS